MSASADTVATRTLHIVVPGDPESVSGGYVYNRRIAAELEEFGWRVTMTGLKGRFPEADALAAASADACLAALPDGAAVVMDGLALGAVPEVARDHARRLALIGLVHLPLCDEGGLDAERREHYRKAETTALAAVRGVIATSGFTVRRLAELGMPTAHVRVVRPGTDPAPLASGSGGPGTKMLCVANVMPRKGHDVLLRALAGLTDSDWTLTCIGSISPDDDWCRHVLELAREPALAGRVSFAGVRTGDALQAAYDEADLFVLPSHFESFGMVLTEALARGLPVVATTGGAVPETLPDDAALLVPAGDAPALGGALSSLIRDAERLARLRAGTVAARDKLETWEEAGRAFEASLREFVGA